MNTPVIFLRIFEGSRTQIVNETARPEGVALNSARADWILFPIPFLDPIAPCTVISHDCIEKFALSGMSFPYLAKM